MLKNKGSKRSVFSLSVFSMRSLLSFHVRIKLRKLDISIKWTVTSNFERQCPIPAANRLINYKNNAIQEKAFRLCHTVQPSFAYNRMKINRHVLPNAVCAWPGLLQSMNEWPGYVWDEQNSDRRFSVPRPVSTNRHDSLERNQMRCCTVACTCMAWHGMSSARGRIWAHDPISSGMPSGDWRPIFPVPRPV